MSKISLTSSGRELGRGRACRRSGFTIPELMVAIGLLLTCLVLIAQIGFASLRERQRQAIRQEALEAAANILEAARGCPWESLTPAWAEAQRLPGPLADRLDQGRLVVRVVPEAGNALLKRVTVEIQWVNADNQPAGPVRLQALYSARHTAKEEKT